MTENRKQPVYTIVPDFEDDEFSYVLAEDGVPVAAFSDKEHASRVFTGMNWGYADGAILSVADACINERQWGFQRYRLIVPADTNAA